MAQTARPYRSVLYIPGSKERALEKAMGLPADGGGATPDLLLQAGAQTWSVRIAGTVAANGAPLAVISRTCASTVPGAASASIAVRVTRTRESTSGGWSQQCVTPTRCSIPPSAATISVALGSSDTTRINRAPAGSAGGAASPRR